MIYKLPEKCVDGFFKRENAIYHYINNEFKTQMMDPARIKQIAIALTHYLFRNGKVEDMHSGGKLSDIDMMILNKFMVNRLAGLLVIIQSNRWLELESILQHYQSYGSEWDKPDPDTLEFDMVWDLLYQKYRSEDQA